MKGNGIGLQGRLKDMWRRYGAGGFAGKCLVKVLAIFGVRVRISCHYAKRLDLTAVSIKSEYRELDQKDFETQVSVLPERFTDEKMSRIKDAFSVEGNHAYGIYDGKVLTVYGWISTIWLVSKSRKLKEGVGYLWDNFTHPAYRGRGLHGDLIRIRERELVRMGKSVAAVTVDFYNRASKVGFERAGYVLKSKVFSWSVGGGRVRSRVKKF